MNHPRTVVLATFASALGSLPSLPVVLTSLAEVLERESALSMVIVPGEETVDVSAHDSGLPTVRRLRVRVVCVGHSRYDADQLAYEVEQAAPYTTAGLGAVYAGSDFAEERGGEHLFFSTRVNFDVLYETTAA